MATSTDLSLLVTVIKQKKELSFVDEAFLVHEIEQYFKKNPTLKSKYTPNPRSALFEKIVKDIRAQLRRVYGLFRGAEDIKMVSTFLAQKHDFSKEEVFSLLTKHSSTSERVSFYPELYSQLFKITGPLTSILDLGCGLNPLSIIFLKKLPKSYYAYDLSLQEVKVLEGFFSSIQKQGCSGSAQVLNILEISKVKKLPAVDLCFLCKMTDVLDKGKGHTVTERVLESIKAKFIVVSFSTRTMSGKKMTAPRRSWIQWLCRRRNWAYSLLEFENEIFYVIKKEQ